MSTIVQQLKNTKKASLQLRQSSPAAIKLFLRSLSALVINEQQKLLKANKADLLLLEPNNPKADRLLLNEDRIKSLAISLKKIAALPDPTGKVLTHEILSNGLVMEKRTVPFGVIGAVYESRPNVTFDIAALCIRSRNACVLKGSREAFHTNRAAYELIRKALLTASLPPQAVLLLSPERASLTEMLQADRLIDLIIPRGSQQLIQYVRTHSRVPVIETGAGVCHIYVEKRADLTKALNIVVNAKTSRPTVCNAMDTLLIDEDIAPSFISLLQKQFDKYQVQVHADKAAYRLWKGYAHLHHALPEDFGKEFLSMQCAVKLVKNMDGALSHIETYSTRHSEAIISESRTACKKFMQAVDAAVVYSNASTRFTDGEMLGLGAEIGISTQKLHARGPFALEKLVTEKWLIKGQGQVR